MKYLPVLFFLLACVPSTQVLIEQAHLTGDWSLVNKRIAAQERREAPPACAWPLVELCKGHFGCECVRLEIRL